MKTRYAFRLRENKPNQTLDVERQTHKKSSIQLGPIFAFLQGFYNIF
jgi:hypothetical protein